MMINSIFKGYYKYKAGRNSKLSHRSGPSEDCRSLHQAAMQSGVRDGGRGGSARRAGSGLGRWQRSTGGISCLCVVLRIFSVYLYYVFS